MKFVAHAFFIVAMSLVPSGLYAQTSSTIIGQITDSLGTTLPNTGIFVLQGQDSTWVSLGISGTDGQFKISDIQAGLYRLQYSLNGYQTAFSDPIRISQGRPIVNIGVQKLKRKKPQPSAKPVITRRARA